MRPGMATVPRPADVVTVVATVDQETDPAGALCRSIVRTAVPVPVFTVTDALMVVSTCTSAEAVDHPVIVVVVPWRPVTAWVSSVRRGLSGIRDSETSDLRECRF